MAKAKPDITYCSYKPNQKVDQLYKKDGVEYWVGPYLVFDPGLEINTSKGMIKRKLKDHQIGRLHDHVPVCTNLESKPVVVHKDRIRSHKKDAVTFAYVFGTVNSGGIILAGASYEKAEDLSLGIDSIQELDN
jgi:hypothetical protein